MEVVAAEDLKIRAEACVELAKLYEHKLKDIPKAIQYCQEAIISVSKEMKMKDNTFDQLQARLNRLEQKYVKLQG